MSNVVSLTGIWSTSLCVSMSSTVMTGHSPPTASTGPVGSSARVTAQITPGKWSFAIWTPLRPSRSSTALKGPPHATWCINGDAATA
eukprot:scaffold115120_cov31-Tisochrysis_lutea.AAC.4